jgi:hypothetical protein
MEKLKENWINLLSLKELRHLASGFIVENTLLRQYQNCKIDKRHCFECYLIFKKIVVK